MVNTVTDLSVAPGVETEAGRVRGPGLVAPEYPALGQVRAALSSVTVSSGTGTARSQVVVRRTVRGEAVTLLGQVTLPARWPALPAGGGEGAGGEVAAGALGAVCPGGEGAGVGLAARVGAVLSEATVTLLPWLCQPVTTDRTGEYLNISLSKPTLTGDTDLLGDVPQAVVHAPAVGSEEVVLAAGGPPGGLAGQGRGRHETPAGAGALPGAGESVVVEAEVVAQLVGHGGRHLVQVIGVPHIDTS